MNEVLLDVKGMSCPLPVLRANRSLRAMAPGERLRVLATDRAAVADFKAFCQETGHALIAMSEESGVLSFVIRRRPEPAQEAGELPEKNPEGESPEGESPEGKSPEGHSPKGQSVRES